MKCVQKCRMGLFHGMDLLVETSGGEEQYYVNELILRNEPQEASSGQKHYYMNGLIP